MLPNFGPFEMIVILGVGLLLFGKRLPEVGRSLGRSIVEFKKGISGVEDVYADAPPAEPRSSAQSPRFDAPPSPRA
ncbi:MAG: Sec-independent protein translocase subunit TatA/TatB [Planctomycetia bacterium]